MKLPNVFMTIDPGDNTGWAIWLDKKLITSGVFKNKFHESDEVRLLQMHHHFYSVLHGFNLLRPYNTIEVVYIEGVSIWAGSLKSITAATSGKLTRLFYLVGVYMTICWEQKARPEVILPQRWKGQMDKLAVKKRVKRAIDMEFKTDHETDAVGMGLHLLGKL